MAHATTQHQRVAVICGASAGIGRAAAIELARQGWAVALIARSTTGLAAALEEITVCGGNALALPADVTDASQVEAAAARAETTLGPVDLWVNAAMVTVFGPAAALTPSEIHQVTDVTYLGTVHGTLAALRLMQPRNRGTIIQVGSALSYRSIPLQAPYCAAKFAVRGFTDALRCELIHERSGIRLTMLQLPAHNTPQFDWGRNRMSQRAQPVPPIHTPEVAARAIAKIALDPPREYWLGKATLQAIVGNMVLPGVLDRLLAARAWQGQLTSEPASPGPDNLFEPVEGVHRTAGRFGDRAQDHALGLRATAVRAAIAGLMLVLLLLAGAVGAVLG